MTTPLTRIVPFVGTEVRVYTKDALGVSASVVSKLATAIILPVEFSGTVKPAFVDSTCSSFTAVTFNTLFKGKLLAPAASISVVTIVLGPFAGASLVFTNVTLRNAV